MNEDSLHRAAEAINADLFAAMGKILDLMNQSAQMSGGAWWPYMATGKEAAQHICRAMDALKLDILPGGAA